MNCPDCEKARAALAAKDERIRTLEREALQAESNIEDLKQEIRALDRRIDELER